MITDLSQDAAATPAVTAPQARTEAPARLLQLPDLAHFAALASRHLATCRHYNTRHAVVLLAVEIPARPGNHAEGLRLQLLLDAVGARLRARLRDSDQVVQLNDMRFGVLLIDAAKADLEAVQARLHRALCGQYGIDGQLLHVLARLGAAIYPGGGSNGPELALAANQALERSTLEQPWGGNAGRARRE